jgi:predicted MPP superfamily phosphohydrolase
VGDRDVALYLCGHTHGGHIALPWGPIYVPGPVGKQISSGFHRIEGMAVLVSRGLGGIELPIRAFAHPDVVVVTLRAMGG